MIVVVFIMIAVACYLARADYVAEQRKAELKQALERMPTLDEIQLARRPPTCRWPRPLDEVQRERCPTSRWPRA